MKQQKVKIAIGGDHGGFSLKEAIKTRFQEAYEFMDIGSETDQVKSDYLGIARQVSQLVLRNEVKVGILICGTGVGMTIAANRLLGIRAALVGDAYSAVQSRAHNHANLLCLGGRILGTERALMLVRLWLETAPNPDYLRGALSSDGSDD